MVTLQSADNALKTLYLGVVADQLNTSANPLLCRFKQTTQDVWGKEIRKMAPFGLNGGIGAGTEDGNLPEPAGNNYAQFVLTLKNLYGTLHISDKAIRASNNSAGAFVNLLNAEMEGLLKASSFNFGRMLFGDGSGILATVKEVSASGGMIEFDTVRNLMEGMVVDFYSSQSGLIAGATGKRITSIDRSANLVYFTGGVPAGLAQNDFITVQGSYNNELTGLGAIFKTQGTLYGISRESNRWMIPYVKENQGAMRESAIQTAIDNLEEVAGSQVDFIVCSAGVKRAYQEHLATYKRNLDVLNLNGGYRALSYNGIPLVSDRFVASGEMFLLNTSDFNLHQLCDWQWLEGEDGRVIKQVNGKPVYTATLVKYADLICNRPIGQGKITGILEK